MLKSSFTKDGAPLIQELRKLPFSCTFRNRVKQ